MFPVKFDSVEEKLSFLMNTKQNEKSTFLYDVFFSVFLSGGVQETAKISHFVDFDLGKMHQNGLSGTFLGFKAC